MSLKHFSPIALSALALALSACGGSSEEATTEASTSTPEEVSTIEQRQDNFEEMGDAFKAIRGQLESGEPDFAVLTENATIINTAAQKVSGFFPEGTGMSSGADTEALDVIWEKPEEFTAASVKLVAASETLLAAATASDLPAFQEAVKGLGGSCKGCHDTFRLDDE